MDDNEYRRTVIKMRRHQDAWFRHHGRDDLISARQLEKTIDDENRRWLDTQKVVRPTAAPEQVNLSQGVNDETERA